MKAQAKWRFLQIDATAMALLAAGACLFYLLAVRPVMRLQECHAAQQAQLDGQKRNIALMNRRVQETRERLVAAGDSLRKIDIPLDDASSVNARLARLAEHAMQRGLKLDEIQPGEPTYGKEYGTVPITLRGAGKFEHWIDFLHDLAARLPDTAVESFQLTGKPEVPASPIEFQVVLRWHVMPSGPKAAIASEERR